MVAGQFFARLVVFRLLLPPFFFSCRLLCLLGRSAGGFNVAQFVEGIVSAEKFLDLFCLHALDLAVKAVNLAGMVDDDIAPGIATGKAIALVLKSLGESMRVFVVLLPGGGDR